MVASVPLSSSAASHGGRAIDRRALVERHRIVLTEVGVQSPLSVGNGQFCFTVDVTGLQTFEAEHADLAQRAIPLATMSDWGWHHKPNPHGYAWTTFPHTPYQSHGRSVEYLYHEVGKCPPSRDAAAEWLYADPNRLHLGRIGLVLRTRSGEPATLAAITQVHQDLDLWTGILTSRFVFDGEPVTVTTVCHGQLDQLAVTIESPLISDGRLAVECAYPYGSATFGGNGADWSRPEAHRTRMVRVAPQRVDLSRTVDADTYVNSLAWESAAELTVIDEHRFQLRAVADLRASPSSRPSRLAFVSAFAVRELPQPLPGVLATAASAAALWDDFWSTGGVIDLSLSHDPRWRELERRIVLSQYLTRIQSAGTLPPQESGLTVNTWFGKFHLEMYWWHVAHWALWGRQELMRASMGFYDRILPTAQKIAADQGYAGARWPKCVGPDGQPAPTYLEAFLLWQQPHPIFLAELMYRAQPEPEILARYQTIVEESARFMASFAAWSAEHGRYEIGPPATDAAEIHYPQAATTKNLNFENAYWHFGLEIAQRWRQRLGQARDVAWDHVLANIPPLAQRDGVYVTGETQTTTWEPGNHWSHPDVLGPLGVLDGALVDHQVMRATLAKVMAEWDWPSTWGWDFPEVAMCAARLGEGATAIEVLLKKTPKNTFLANGHNWQTEMLSVYLPGNAGLLYAVALMAAGWDGAPPVPAPGFPQDGSWTVRWEGLLPAPADYHRPG